MFTTVGAFTNVGTGWDLGHYFLSLSLSAN